MGLAQERFNPSGSNLEERCAICEMPMDKNIVQLTGFRTDHTMTEGWT